jgi:hypothetical protein
MPRLRVHNLAVSLDGYAAGRDQGLEHPLGVGGERLLGDLPGAPPLECAEFVASPSVAHVRLVPSDGRRG